MTDASISRDAVRAVFESTRTLPDVHTSTHELMGGSGTLIIVGAGETLLADLWHYADKLEQLWSRFVPGSDLMRLNWAEGKPTSVNPETIILLEAMRDGHAITQGSYDPTLLPDVMAAGYTTSQLDSSRVTTLPASAQSPGNLAAIRIDGTTVTMPRGTTIDPGGIGKGLAADLLVERARAAGVWGVMAELGGDIAVWGQAPDGHGWHLGIENPSAPEQHLDVVSVAHGGIVTSSQLKRRFGSGAHSTHHLVDPATRLSAATEVQTATVLAGSAARAEALAKRAFVENPDQFLSWLPTVGAAGFMLLADGSTRETTNWGEYR